MLKFYTDKHIPKAAVKQLRARGIDIVRCEEVGLGDAKDADHLEYAASQGRVMITRDQDFARLNKKWMLEEKHHAGILLFLKQVQGNAATGIIVSAVLLYHETTEDSLDNQLIFVR